MKVKVYALHLITAGIVLCFASALIAGNTVITNAQTDRRSALEQKIEEKRQEVLEKQEAKRAEIGEKKEEQRIASCERNTEKLKGAMERLTGQAERHLGVISSFQTKVENFYASGQLTVDTYDELHAAVVAAEQYAKDNVEALSQAEVDIDCTSAEVASSVGVYRAIADETKTALKVYRQSLVDLISTLKAETSADDSSDNSDSTEAENSVTESEEQ